MRDEGSVLGLRVRVWQDASPEWGLPPHEYATAAGSVEVDETGRFVFPECSEGPIRLEIVLEQPGAWAPRIPERFEVEPGETTTVEIPFERENRPIAEAIERGMKLDEFQRSERREGLWPNLMNREKIELEPVPGPAYGVPTNPEEDNWKELLP